MNWRRAARSTWQSTLNIAGLLIVLFLLAFLFGAFRIFFVKLIVPLGPVIAETIGRNRMVNIWDTAVMCSPYAACPAGAGLILYLIRRINRRDDPQYAALPLSDLEEPPETD